MKHVIIFRNLVFVIGLHTTPNVSKVDVDIRISVRPLLLMMEAKCMKKLMDDSSMGKASSGKTHLLLSSTHTNIGRATGMMIKQENNTITPGVS